jgi:hypothetical protein
MVSRWIEPEPRRKQVDEAPPYNPDAPSFDLMKRQVGKKPPKYIYHYIRRRTFD